MAITKTNSTLYSTSLTAGAGNVTSSVGDLTAVDEAVIDIKLTNGGTGPTVPAQVQIEVSGDNSNWFADGGPLRGSTVNSAVASWGGIKIAPGTAYVRAILGSNTGQAVTPRVSLTTTTKT